MDRKRKTWFKFLVRHITADVYLGKWHRIKSFVRWVEPLLNLDAAARVLGLPFDFIFAFDILEHIPDDAAALEHCAAMLAPGGRFIASVPSRLSLNERGLWVPSPGPPDHVRTGYDLDALSALVRAAGLRPVFHRYYFSPVMIRAWRVFTALDRISRPLTLIALPFYHYCFLREPAQNPDSGNAFFLVAEKP